MEKLTKTQQKIIDKLIREKNKIENSNTVFEWLCKDYSEEQLKEKHIINALKKNSEEKYYIDTYKDRKNNIFIIKANTKTLEQLEKLNYIKIIKLDKSTTGIDTIKLLKY